MGEMPVRRPPPAKLPVTPAPQAPAKASKPPAWSDEVPGFREPPEPPRIPKRNEQYGFHFSWVWIIAAVLGLWAWLWGLGGESDFPVVVSYVGLGIAAGAVAHRLARPFPARWARWAETGSIALALVVCGSLDRYEKRWTLIHPGDPKPIRLDYADQSRSLENFPREVMYDTHKRFGDRLFYRRIAQWGRAGEHICDQSGAITPSGERHGKWSVVHYENGKLRETAAWYWYGEKIREGEWHLRDR